MNKTINNDREEKGIIYYNERCKKIKVEGCIYFEHSYNIICFGIGKSKIIDMGLAREISVFINNLGKNPIKYYFECSPDKKIYIMDGIEKRLGEGEAAILVPSYFAKYGRIKIISDEKVIVKVIVQEQICG